MAIQGLVNIRKALATLNPKQVREMSERNVRVALHAGSQEAFQRMENFLLRDLSPARRRSSALLISRATGSQFGQQPDIDIYDEGVVAPAGAIVFQLDRPHRFIEKTL